MAHISDRWHSKVITKNEDGSKTTKKVRTARYGSKGRWLVRWHDPSGRECAKAFDREVDAERHLTSVRADLQQHTYVDPKSTTTVGEYAKKWAKSRPHRKSTETITLSRIENHIVGTRLGGRRLIDVTPSEMQAWVTDRSKVLSPSTLHVVVGLVRSIFSAAVLDRKVATSPATRLALPKATKERVVPLTVAQVRLLSEKAPKRCQAMIVTQAGLGLRIGELTGLRVQDVDFLRRTARVEDQLAPDAKSRMPPKTPRSRRTIPMPTVVGEALSEHIRQFPPGQDGSLFTTEAGNPWRHDYYGRQVFAKAVVKAKLPAGTTTHDLRHHFASVLLAAGESVVAVAERLGHENATLVLTTYGHLMADTEDRTRKAVDDAWAAKPNVAVTDHTRTKPAESMTATS